MRKNKGRMPVKVVAFTGVTVALFFLMQFLFLNLQQGQLEEGQLQLEQAIRRAAVACYATEGFYPPNLEYMKEYYGIQIDEKRYLVIYDVFAQNLMPDITVLKYDERI